MLTAANSYQALISYGNEDLKQLAFEKDRSVVGDMPARRRDSPGRDHADDLVGLRQYRSRDLARLSGTLPDDPIDLGRVDAPRDAVGLEAVERFEISTPPARMIREFLKW